MSFTLKLDPFTHDLSINSSGTFNRISGAEEVRQRIKIAIYHEQEEYFLNVPNGVPWYSKLLGLKGGREILSNAIRKKILETPGVIRILSFFLSYKPGTRLYSPIASVLVEKNSFEETDYITIDGIYQTA